MSRWRAGGVSKIDAILVALRVDDRVLPLAEGAVERRVDRGDRHIHARGGVAVDDDLGAQAAVLLVGGHVDEFAAPASGAPATFSRHSSSSSSEASDSVN